MDSGQRCPRRFTTGKGVGKIQMIERRGRRIERGWKIPRILIVDDEKLVRFVMERALDKLEIDFRLDSVSGGHEAFDLIEQEPVDLVITDIKMPDGGGVELTERMRESGMDSTVVWVTAYGCEGYREDAERLGVFRCVEKPLEVSMIRQVVEDALQDG